MGSIPTRSRHLRRFLLLAFAIAVARSVAAQDSTAAAPDTVPVDTARPDSIPRDTISPAATVPDSLTARPVRPFGAFWRSLLVPGWGQLKVGRKVTAGLFVVTEGITLGMSIKANQDLGYLRRIGADSAAIAAKVRTREDWYVLLAVNHLLAGLEAFIAAQLLDFPAELRVERAPGRVDAGIAVPFRLP